MISKQEIRRCWYKKRRWVSQLAPHCWPHPPGNIANRITCWHHYSWQSANQINPQGGDRSLCIVTVNQARSFIPTYQSLIHCNHIFGLVLRFTSKSNGWLSRNRKEHLSPRGSRQQLFMPSSHCYQHPDSSPDSHIGFFSSFFSLNKTPFTHITAKVAESRLKAPVLSIKRVFKQCFCYD